MGPCPGTPALYPRDAVAREGRRVRGRSAGARERPVLNRGREGGPPWESGKLLLRSRSIREDVPKRHRAGTPAARRTGSGPNKAPRLTWVWGPVLESERESKSKRPPQGAPCPEAWTRGGVRINKPLTVRAPAGHQRPDHGPPETPPKTCLSVGKRGRLALLSLQVRESPCAKD